MKRIYLYLSILFVFGVVCNSCISEKVKEVIVDPNPEPEPEPEPVKDKTFSFTTTIEFTAFAKRTDMGNNRIGLFLYNGDNSIQGNTPITLSNGGGRFDVLTNYATAFCFGYFPYSSSAVSGTVYTGEISAVQNQDASLSPSTLFLPESLENQLLMISTQSQYASIGGDATSTQFKNVFSLLCFQISKGDLSGLGNQRLTKAEIYISNKTDTLTPLSNYKLAGSYSIDLKNSAYAGIYDIAFSSSASSKITANITNSPLIDVNNLFIWSVVAPFNIGNDMLVLHLEMEDDFGYKSYSTQTFSDFGEIARNVLKTFEVVLNKNNVSADDIVKDQNNFVSRPANSYIVSESGNYKISTRKPNGNPVTGGSDVVWLWASKEGGGSLGMDQVNNLINKISYNSENMEIQFRVGSNIGTLNKGNVVLALRDAAGNILWTWHIWITDKPKDILYSNNTIFMDRNLGALSTTMRTTAIDNYGFVYQWGRKDPFIGGNGMINETSGNILSIAQNNSIVNPALSPTDWSRSTSVANYSDIVNPLQFIYNNTASEDSPADWLSIRSAGDETVWSINKTNHDPCPYGYKVPANNDIKSLLDAAKHSPGEFWYFEFKDNKYWEHYYTPDGVVGDLSVWPAAGYRQGRGSYMGNSGAQLINSGTSSTVGQCLYWTSTPFTKDGVVIPGVSSRMKTSGNVVYSEHEHGDNADALSVRCVKYNP